MRPLRLCVCMLLAAIGGAALGADPPSKTGIDAPELARLGAFAVGFRTLELVHAGQPDVLDRDPKTGVAPLRDRRLTVDLWYPAAATPGAATVTYTATVSAELPEAPRVTFSVPGLAVRDAKAVGSGHPLVIVSHGYGGAPAALTWLTENLASKGYVVAAIHHEDPPYGDRSKFAGPVLRRPLDIAFVAASLQSSLGAQGLVDPARTALVGYSMGSYGVLAAAGAALEPELVKQVVGEVMLPYARGGDQADTIHVKGLRAVVALAASATAWGPNGAAAIKAPLLLIAGDHDHTIDYTTGTRAVFDKATGTQRFLLTYKFGGHNIGFGPAPESMQHDLWNLDWFEDPVWRKDRLIAINLHMITAFFDRYVNGDESRAAYLDVPVADSSSGVWPAPGPARWADLSSGTNGVTVWKGFQRGHAEGLELLQRAAQTPAP